MTDAYVKYKTEYDLSSDKKTFIKLVSNRYKDIKLATIDRKWYEMKSKFPKQVRLQRDEIYLDYSKEEMSEPHHLKQILVADIMRLQPERMTRENLTRHGLTPGECNWVDKHIMKLK